MAFSNQIQGPQDYQNFFHTNKDGNILLGEDGKPISLQKTVTGPTTTISPLELWNSKETRHMTHLPHDPQLKRIASSTMIDPKTGLPPEMTLSPIKDRSMSTQQQKILTEQTFKALLDGASDDDIQLLNGNLAVILKKLKEGTLTLPDQNSTDSKTTLQKLKESEKEKEAFKQELFQVRQELKIQNQNLGKDFDTRLQNYKNKLAQSHRQNQILTDQIQQLKTDQDSFRNVANQTHQKEIETLQANNAALTNSVTQLQQQLQVAQCRQVPPQYPQYPQYPMNQTFDTSLLTGLSTSLTMQANIAKQQLLIQAKSYDGKDPNEFFDWLDEINRLSSQNDYTPLEVAIQTSRGSVHKYLQELQTQRLPWDTIKFKLRERYSDCSSSAAARSKLTLLKQDGRLLHEYISHFRPFRTCP